jgi:hypothetical protein
MKHSGNALHSSRRSFLKKGAVAAGAAAVGAGVLGTTPRALAEDEPSGSLHRGDAAILRLLLALETIESDLCQQYAEMGSVQLGGSKIDLPFPINGSPAYISALEVLDGDMPQYIADNSDDEFSHAAFLRAYLNSKGADGDSTAKQMLQFKTLPSSKLAPGNQANAKRLTNLMELTVDTTWWTRYRSDSNNPDLDPNFMFDQAVPSIFSKPRTAIPRDSSDVTDQNHIQAIANTAAFHFALIEQGGSSLYPSLAQRVSNVEVLHILLSIGPTETSHFQTWHDKAGNAVSDPVAPLVDPADPTLVFPNLNDQTKFPNQDEFQTNLIMPEPTFFLSRKFPIVSIIRPTETQGAAKGAVAALTADGLFNGQSQTFFNFLNDLAEDADEARRDVD